jgi:hypothetical protein
VLCANRMTRIDPLSFWSWAHSDFLSNAERGVLAEFIVGKALDAIGTQRSEWDAWDLTMPNGVKIEVKASGYVQSWAQTKPSIIRFSMREAKGWIAKTNTFSDVVSRPADVYVFCIHTEVDKNIADPLDLNQWEFIVIPTKLLNEKLGAQKSVGLSTLLKIGGESVVYENLSSAVSRAVA